MQASQFKPFVPSPIWNLARRTKTYVGRLLIWRSVVRHISGASEADQLILDRSVLAGAKAAFRNLDIWQDPQLLADAVVVVQQVGRFRARALTDDLYHLLPSREPAVLRFLRSRLKEGDTFIDAGANIGFYTIAASRKIGATGRVIAVEMMPDTAGILRQHISLNGCSNVDVMEHALSSRSGDSVEASVPIGKFGQASIQPRNWSDGSQTATVQVLTITLDELAAKASGPIAIIKLDLEGAEFDALLGATHMLNQARAVIFEQLDADKRASDLLRQAGFTIRALDANNLVAERI